MSVGPTGPTRTGHTTHKAPDPLLWTPAGRPSQTPQQDPRSNTLVLGGERVQRYPTPRNGRPVTSTTAKHTRTRKGRQGTGPENKKETMENAQLRLTLGRTERSLQGALAGAEIIRRELQEERAESRRLWVGLFSLKSEIRRRARGMMELGHAG